MQAINIALDGLLRSQEMFDRSARQIARLPGALPNAGYGAPAADVVDLSAAMVAMLEARNAHSVNLQVLQEALDIEKNLLDVFG